jgi:hypothetical protein
MGSVAVKANLTEVCSGCSKLSSHLISCAGDRLCATCRAVIWAALVLLNRGVADKDTIIPTMVFAKVAGGSPKFAALVEERLPAVDIPRLMREARGQSTDGTKDERQR